MQLTFNKLSDNKWYIDLPEWEGDFADLEMVAGADDLLEILSQKLHRKSITFNVWTSKPDVPCASMTLIDNDCEGATYQVNNFMFYKGTAWLCNVARFVFGGIHPRYIFFKVANNAPKKDITTAKDWVEQFNEAAEDRRTTGSNLAAMKIGNLQKMIYKETMEIVNNGSYTTEDGTKVTLPNWKEMYENSVLYSDPIELDATKLATYDTEVRVENIDCLIAAHNLQLRGLNPVVLNLASPVNPGGGVIRGASAQEENLFRRSNLFKSMYQFAKYAEEYGLQHSDKQYPLDNNHGGVYTPNAVVFRGTQAKGYPLLKEPHIISFVAVAGISHPRLIGNELAPEEIIITKNKIRTIFRIALKHGHDSIVLGALGCGAFCNPPAHIARLFHEVMEEAEFKNHFKMLLFAIIEDHNSRRRHNPDGNLIPFMREFGCIIEEVEQEESQDDMDKKNYDLDRFVNAQEYAYPIALKEMQNGRKMGHWIWYIFPQQKGLGHSYNSEYYGLDGLNEARAYLKHPVLGERLREICQALLNNRHRNIRNIMGSSIDVLKLKTSMNLFDLVSPNDIFRKVLDAFF